jgi:hypothetical protein
VVDQLQVLRPSLITCCVGLVEVNHTISDSPATLQSHQAGKHSKVRVSSSMQRARQATYICAAGKQAMRNQA